MSSHPTSHRHRAPRRRWLAAAVAAVVASVAVIVAAVTWTSPPAPPGPVPAAQPAAATSTLDPSPTPTTSPPTLASEQVDAVADAGFPNGVEMQVGTPDGLREGLWQSMGGPNCAWSRSRGAGWVLDTGGHPGHPITIGLRGTTSWFTTKGCSLWTYAGPA